MIIYIDLLFILNFVYDLLLLMTVSITLKRNTKIIRLLMGTLFGSLTTFIIFIKISKYLIFFIKILCSIGMLLITFGFYNIKYFINNMIYLYMCSVILAGFLYYLKIEFNNISYLISLLIGPLILYLYINEQKKLKKIINYYHDVIIIFKNNKILECKGFVDSGNNLKDPITNKYIILINKKKLKGIYNIRSPMYVPIKTINKHSLLECISIKNVLIDNKNYDNYLLGLTDEFKRIEECDCLLNYHLMEE